MVTLDSVQNLFRSHLAADEPAKLQQAGEVWKSLPLFFFYSKTGQDRINIAVVEVAVRAAADDGVNLGDEVLASLQSVIHPTTTVNNATKMIALALFKPDNA